MSQRVIQLTDLHFFTDPDALLKGVPTRAAFDQVWDHLLREDPEFDWLLLTGDLAHDELRSTYKILRSKLEPWVSKLRILPGNHDHRASMREIFPEITPAQTGASPEEPLWFDVRAGQWRLLGLDSHIPGEVPGYIQRSQIHWLREQLAGDQSPTMLFLHHPPVAVGTKWMDEIGLKNDYELQPIIQQYPHVRVVCSGHVHHDHQGTVHQAAYYATPSTGVQFKPKSKGPAGDPLPPGYRVITLDGDQYSTVVKRVPELRYPPAG